MENVNTNSYMKELIESTDELYHEINQNIQDLIMSRIRQDKKKEEEHLFRMETIMCQTLQQLDCILTVFKEENPNII